MRKSSRKPDWQKKIARERIGILFSLAKNEFSSHPERSNRYVQLAGRIGKRYNIKLGSREGSFCRKCMHFLVPGRNSRVRTSPRQEALIVKCLDCGSLSRHPYRREKASGK